MYEPSLHHREYLPMYNSRVLKHFDVEKREKKEGKKKEMLQRLNSDYDRFDTHGFIRYIFAEYSSGGNGKRDPRK